MVTITLIRYYGCIFIVPILNICFIYYGLLPVYKLVRQPTLWHAHRTTNSTNKPSEAIEDPGVRAQQK